MTYEEYKAIAELVDVFFKYWGTAASLRELVGTDAELICEVINAYAVISSQMIKTIPLVENYPDFKKRWMEEAGYITPTWAKEIIKGCEK